MCKSTKAGHSIKGSGNDTAFKMTVKKGTVWIDEV